MNRRLQSRKQRGLLEEKAGMTGGKSNRVLHTDQLPKKREKGFPRTPWEDYRVRFADKEIGLGNTYRVYTTRVN